MIPLQISKLEENNADLTHDNDLLQIQLNEAEHRIRVLSATFTATNSEMDKEFQVNVHLEQSVKSQQVMIAKLRKEQKQMTSTNQSLAKQLEETNVKYDKLQNEYDLVTKDGTQYINELQYAIDELQKRITAQNQEALPQWEQTSDTLPNAENQKTEDILEGGARVGAHFARRTQVLPSIPLFSHSSSGSTSFWSTTSNRSSFGPAFNKMTSPRLKLLAVGKQICQPPPYRMSINSGRLRSESVKLSAAHYVGPKLYNAQSAPLDADNFLGTDSVLYSEDRHSERSDSVISEPLEDNELLCQLHVEEVKEQSDASNETNINQIQNCDLLQMGPNEADHRTHSLSGAFNGTNFEMDKEFESQQKIISNLQQEKKQMTLTNESLAKQLKEINAKYDQLQNEYDLVTRDGAVIPQNKNLLPSFKMEKISDTTPLPNEEHQKTDYLP